MVRAFFSNSIGILVSRILGLIRDLMTASVLGASVWSDIFFVAFKLPNLFRRLFAEGAFTQAFLPSFIKARQKGIFASEIVIKFLGVIAILTLVVMLFAPFFTKILAFGFDEKTILDAVPLVRINFFYLIFIFMVTFFASMLQYKGHFATTAFSTALLNISMIVALILSQDKDDKIVVYYMSFGVVIGGFLQLLVHLIALQYKKILRILLGGFKRVLQGQKTDTKGFYLLFFSGILGNSAAQLTTFINTWFASFLGAGAISYLYYADRIFQLPLALFAIALSTALFPKIAKLIKINNIFEAKKSLSNCFHFLLLMLLLATICGIIFSEIIVKIIFERGNFTASNSKDCAVVLCMYLFGLVPYGISKLFSLWLYSKMLQNLAAKITIKILFINLAFCLILFYPMGVNGLALASSISGFFLFFLNLKAFGFRNFLDIISLKKFIFIALICVSFTIFLLFLKDFLYAYLF